MNKNKGKALKWQTKVLRKKMVGEKIMKNRQKRKREKGERVL